MNTSLNSNIVKMKILRTLVFIFLITVVCVIAWRSINYISASIPDCDSGSFASGGYFLLKGKVLYKDFLCYKPPIVFLLNEAALSIGDISLNPIRTMERFFAVSGGIIFFLIIYLLFKNMWLAFVASVFYIMHFFRPTVLEGGNLTEEYGAVFVLFGILFAVVSNKTKKFSYTAIFISGMFFAAAFFTKEPFLLSSITWFIYLILYKDRNYINILKRSSVFIAGAALILAAVVIYLLINDSFKNWLDILSWGKIYASMSPRKLGIFEQISKNYKLAYNKLFGTTLITGLFAIVGIFSVVHWQFVKKYKYIPITALVFGVLDFYATMLSPKGYGHYYLQLVPSYIIISATGVAFLLDAFKKSRIIQTVFILAIVLLSFNIDKNTYNEYKKRIMMPAKKAVNDNIAEYIKANSTEKDTIWITTTFSPRYYIETQRLSPTIFYVLSDEVVLVNTYLSTAEEKFNLLMDELKKNPPKFIIAGDANIKVVNRTMIKIWVDNNYFKIPLAPNDKQTILLELKPAVNK